MKISFNVQGMTCAACSARVEKATSAVPGVASVAVNLLKNSMEVQLAADADAAEIAAAIESAVKKAGYGASPKGQAGASSGPGAAAATSSGVAAGSGVAAENPNAAAEAEQKSMLHRLIASLVFTVPLFYLSMGHMMGWPLPGVFLGHGKHAHVRVHAVLIAAARHLRELQVLPRGLQNAGARRAEHGLAHRAGLGGVHHLRHLGHLPHRLGHGARRYRGAHRRPWTCISSRRP